MAKPTWKPDVPQRRNPLTGRVSRDTDYVLCGGCGWRSVRRSDGPWCPTCRSRAAEMGGPREAPKPLRVPATLPKRGYSDEQKALIDSLLPVTCARCGAGDHVSTDCPLGQGEAG